MAASDVSEGEIVEDLSEISSAEDDYFENLKKLTASLTARKLELELENQIAFGQFADYGKENHYSNYRQRPSTKQKRLKSGSRYDSSRDAARNRSYRASSVFSNYSVPKRRKTRIKKTFHKLKRTKAHFLETASSDEDNKSAIVIDIKSEDESSDEELLKLRLTALKSKQEVKELINEEIEEPVESSQLTVAKQPTEEDNLRILALKSAMLKKKEFFKERKKQRMMENERPYSPSDDLTPLTIDDDAMVFSPLGSPFNEIETVQQEIDMDISNSPLNEEKETSDMDIAPSPSDGNLQPFEDEDNDEEFALRSLLLTSIHRKKDHEKTRSPTPETLLDSAPDESIAKNLKMAVQRLKKLKEKPVPKSGTKTIAMILEEQKNKKKKKHENFALPLSIDSTETSVSEVKCEDSSKQNISVKKSTQVLAPFKIDKSIVEESQTEAIEVVSDKVLPSVQIAKKAKETKQNHFAPPVQPLPPPVSESFLFKTITNDFVSPAPKILEVSKTVDRGSPQDSSFSTITDTKNIPLLPASNKAKRSRLITSFEAVTKPVQRLVIAVHADSDTDEDSVKSGKSSTKKATRKIIRGPNDIPNGKTATWRPEFDMKLESFLKNIRLQQEKTGSDRTANVTTTTSNKATEQSKTVAPVATTVLTKTTSSLKHLPLSSQVEYEQLLQKMRTLERLKARQLKRTKSIPTESSTVIQPTSLPQSPKKTAQTKVEVQKKTSVDKITESLSKISQLDEAAQQRLIGKTEINYQNHSTNLMNASRQSIKVLEDNESDMKRQERLVNQIFDIEQILKKHKASLNLLNQKMKVNAHKIVQSQREMIKLRTHQKNFGKICMQVGTMIRGEEYCLPEHQSVEVEENFSKIVSKTENVIKASSDLNVKSNMKLIAERVKSFIEVKETVAVVASAINETAKPSDDQINEESKKDEITTNSNTLTKEMPFVASVVVEDNLETSSTVQMTSEQSEVSKMIKENNEQLVKFPEIPNPTQGVIEKGKESVKRLQIDPVKDQNVVKKLKYESPLEFRRVPKNKYG